VLPYLLQLYRPITKDVRNTKCIPRRIRDNRPVSVYSSEGIPSRQPVAVHSRSLRSLTSPPPPPSWFSSQGDRGQKPLVPRVQDSHRSWPRGATNYDALACTEHTHAYTHIHRHTLIVSFPYILLLQSPTAHSTILSTHRTSCIVVHPLCFWKRCTHYPSKLAHPVLPRRSGNVHHDGRPPLIDDNMLALWHENDRYSFEDSDRFEEDSLCTWSSEPESACINWRGWRKPTELNTEDG